MSGASEFKQYALIFFIDNRDVSFLIPCTAWLQVQVATPKVFMALHQCTFDVGYKRYFVKAPQASFFLYATYPPDLFLFVIFQVLESIVNFQLASQSVYLMLEWHLSSCSNTGSSTGSTSFPFPVWPVARYTMILVARHLQINLST